VPPRIRLNDRWRHNRHATFSHPDEIRATDSSLSQTIWGRGTRSLDWHRRLLRACRNRPSRRSAEKRDELATTDHSITTSAATSILSGMMRSSDFAALRLMTVSNLVGCWIGSSPGFAPARILTTYSAVARY
jgi:hypothetical protein